MKIGLLNLDVGNIRSVYNVLKSVKDVDERPLYDKNSIVYKQNQMDGLRYNLAMRQGWRCLHCQNPILPKDIYNYKIHYTKHLNSLFHSFDRIEIYQITLSR